MSSIRKLAVFVTLVLGSFAADEVDERCKNDITITTSNPDIPCDTVEGNVIVDKSVSGNLIIDGPKTFKKDFIVDNCTQLLSISSPTIQKIGGEFKVRDGTYLGSINCPAMSECNSFALIRVLQLTSCKLSPSGFRANTMNFEDTFLNSLDDMNIREFNNFKATSNNKLMDLELNVSSIPGTFILSHNGGNNLQVKLNDVINATEFQFSHIKTCEVNSLSVVKSGIKFDTCPNLESFVAPNLTRVGTAKNGGSVSAINNKMLEKFSCPSLEIISGDLTAVNNTKLEIISGFGALKTCDNVLLGGNIRNASFPKLVDVKGTMTIKSTYSYDDVCKPIKSSFSNGVVQGKIDCKGSVDESTANSQDRKSGKDDSGAGVPGFSSAAIFLVLVAAAVQLL